MPKCAGMEGKKIYLFRHGETIATQNRYGWYGLKFYSADILAHGIPALERLGEYLKDIPTELNLTSPFKRCQSTNKVVGGRSNKKFDYHAYLTDHLFLVPKLLFKKRVKKFYKEIMSHSAQTIAICTHEAVIKTLFECYSKEHNFICDGKINSKPGVLTVLSNGEVRQISFRD